MLFTALDLKLAKERYDVLVELLKASRITGWMIEPIAWQNGHLKVAHVMINTPDEDKSRDLQFDLENPDEFRNAMREIANFPFPKGMDTEGTYISNYNSQHLQTTHCNLLCKNSLKIRINLLKKPIHLYNYRSRALPKQTPINKRCDVINGCRTSRTRMGIQKQNCRQCWLSRP